MYAPHSTVFDHLAPFFSGTLPRVQEEDHIVALEKYGQRTNKEEEEDNIVALGKYGQIINKEEEEEYHFVAMEKYRQRTNEEEEEEDHVMAMEKYGQKRRRGGRRPHRGDGDTRA